MSETATISLSEKIRLYLTASGITPQEYVICEPGKCWKDNAGKFTIKSRLAYVKQSDGLRYRKNFHAVQATGEAIPEEEALKYLFFGYLKSHKIHLCQRCGGAGGAQQWPGWTCYDCNGSCIDPHFDFEKALTDSLAGEDFAGDYVARKAAEREELDLRQKQVRDEAFLEAKLKRDAFLVDNAELFQRAKNCLNFLGIGTKGQWAQALENFIGYEASNAIPNSTKEIEEICKKVEFQQIERDRQAATSEYIGTRGERQDFTARVQFTKSFEKEWGTSHITVLHDDDGNVIKYWNHINILDPQPDNPKAKRPAVKGERVTFSATVIEHDTYQGVKQTTVQRATKGKLA